MNGSNVPFSSGGIVTTQPISPGASGGGGGNGGGPVNILPISPDPTRGSSAGGGGWSTIQPISPDPTRGTGSDAGDWTVFAYNTTVGAVRRSGCPGDPGTNPGICRAGGSGYLPRPGAMVNYSPGAANVGLEGIGPCGSCKS